VPTCERGQAFDDLTRQFSDHEIVSAETPGDAFAALAARIPDLVVFPLTLPQAQKAELLSRLRQWSADQLDDDFAASSAAGAEQTQWFYWI